MVIDFAMHRVRLMANRQCAHQSRICNGKLASVYERVGFTWTKNRRLGKFPQSLLQADPCHLREMPLTVLVDREAKKEVGERPVDAMMRVRDVRWKGTIFVASGGWENSMNNKHLPRLFAQALNEKQLELFDEFLPPEAQ